VVHVERVDHQRRRDRHREPANEEEQRRHRCAQLFRCDDQSRGQNSVCKWESILWTGSSARERFLERLGDGGVSGSSTAPRIQQMQDQLD
jgi:hypothetical protein